MTDKKSDEIKVEKELDSQDMCASRDGDDGEIRMDKTLEARLRELMDEGAGRPEVEKASAEFLRSRLGLELEKGETCTDDAVKEIKIDD